MCIKLIKLVYIYNLFINIKIKMTVLVSSEMSDSDSDGSEIHEGMYCIIIM